MPCEDDLFKELNAATRTCYLLVSEVCVSDSLLKPYAFVMLAKVSFAFGSPKARILQTLEPKARYEI